MQHICTLVPSRDSLTEFFQKGVFRKLRKFLLISTDNSLCVKYFRSEKALKKEIKRQLSESSSFIIHPLSKFRAWYEIYLIFLYMANLIYKPLEAAFVFKGRELFPGQHAFVWILNSLNYIDIMMNFLTGYVVTNANRVELRGKYIARHYVKSVFFFSDVVSSIPRLYGYKDFDELDVAIWLYATANILNLFKIFRLASLIMCIHRTADYFRWNVKERLLLVYSALLTVIIIHWLTCLQYMIPVYGYYFWYSDRTKEMFDKYKREPTLQLQYRNGFMKTSAEILGIRNDGADPNHFSMIAIEDYVISMFTYLLGKILMASIWIILAMTIMGKRSMEIKFVEVINQLEAYMTHKGFPMNLREKLVSYYQFKYQNKFFKEKYVHELLSNELHKEVNIHVCRSLISKVSIFASMSQEEITELVPKLIPEIFLPKETIFRAGSLAESMYFISSGTVAVYTRSGKEVCHIQEGGYFNEVAMVLKVSKSFCTFVCIEMTEVYRLSQKDFEKHLLQCKSVSKKIIEQAEKKLKIINSMEKDYKRDQFERKFGIQKLLGSSDNISIGKRQSKVSLEGHRRRSTVVFNQTINTRHSKKTNSKSRSPTTEHTPTNEREHTPINERERAPITSRTSMLSSGLDLSGPGRIEGWIGLADLSDYVHDQGSYIDHD